MAQPRRVAATGLAKRLSKERGFDSVDDSDVSFQIGGNSSSNLNKSKIHIVTYGILVNMISAGKQIPYTHVILDEVHERSLDFDVSLAILRQHLIENINIKLILMSATIHVDEIRKYFTKEGLSSEIVEIRNRAHNIQEFNLESIANKLNLSPKVRNEILKIPNTARKFTEARRNVLIQLVSYLHKRTPIKSGILIFVTGISIILELTDLIQQALRTSNKNFEIFHLHSCYPTEVQVKALQPFPGKRKVFFFF